MYIIIKMLLKSNIFNSFKNHLILLFYHQRYFSNFKFYLLQLLLIYHVTQITHKTHL